MRIEDVYSMRQQIIAALADPNNYQISGLDETRTKAGLARLPHCASLKAAHLNHQAHSAGRNMVQLMLGHDFGLEPSLQAYNGPDLAAAAQATESWRGEPSSFEKAWEDSSQFEGPTVHHANNFIVQSNDRGGLDVFLNSTQKEHVINRSHVVHRALQDGQEPIEYGAFGRKLLNLLESGVRIYSRDEKPWYYCQITNNITHQFVRSVRDMFRHELGVSRHEFMALGAGEHTYIVVIQEEGLEKAFDKADRVRDYEMSLRCGFANSAGDPAALENVMQALMDAEAYEVLASVQALEGRDDLSPNN